MKLIKFKRQVDYQFTLTFENGEIKEIDLKGLIGQYVDINTLNTVHIDSEWGCLEFKGGMVDIEPKTLYRYALLSSCFIHS
jgi:hypothetical protein